MKTKIVVGLLLLGASLSCAPQPPTYEAKSSGEPTGSPSPAKPRNSIDVVKVSVSDISAKPNQSVDAPVQVTIDKGYHINANPPTFPYLKATELEVLNAPGIGVNFVVYPDPQTRTFAFAEKPLAVYEGTINIKAQLKIGKDAKPGTLSVPAKLRVQACDEEVCYAPGTLDVSLPLNIQ